MCADVKCTGNQVYLNPRTCWAREWHRERWQESSHMCEHIRKSVRWEGVHVLPSYTGNQSFVHGVHELSYRLGIRAHGLSPTHMGCGNQSAWMPYSGNDVTYEWVISWVTNAASVPTTIHMDALLWDPFTWAFMCSGNQGTGTSVHVLWFSEHMSSHVRACALILRAHVHVQVTRAYMSCIYVKRLMCASYFCVCVSRVQVMFIPTISRLLKIIGLFC